MRKTPNSWYDLFASRNTEYEIPNTHPTMTYLQIAVHVPQVTGTFDYHLPPALEGQVQPGCLVTVPFGQQTVQGIVIGEVEVPAVADTRPVESLLDPVPAVTPAQIALAQHLAEATLAPLACEPRPSLCAAPTMSSHHGASPSGSHVGGFFRFFA